VVLYLRGELQTCQLLDVNTEMDPALLVKSLPLLNLLALGAISIYLIFTGIRPCTAAFLLISLLPLLTFELGSHLFVQTAQSSGGALLIVLGIGLSPLGFTPLSHGLSVISNSKLRWLWLLYYVSQLIILTLMLEGLVRGGIIEWVTAILDQPVILIDKSRRLYFLNVLIASGVSLFCFEDTLRRARGSQLEGLKYVAVAFLGFFVCFSYIAWNISIYSYISQSILLSGSGIISLGILLLVYSLAKYPLWGTQLNISRNFIFGCLSFTGVSIYLVISGNLLAFLQSVQPQAHGILLPVATFALSAILLLIYLSPYFRKKFENVISRNFFRNKYDYRQLWMRFSEKASGSLSLDDVLPKVADFVADIMFITQVVIWLRSPSADTFSVAYRHDPISLNSRKPDSLRLNPSWMPNRATSVYHISEVGMPARRGAFPLDSFEPIINLGVNRIVPVTSGDRILGFLGVGPELDDRAPSLEDDQLLANISSQLAHLMLTHQLSEELLLAREWEFFNRFSSFIVHDLKNLATLQSMTLENAKKLRDNPAFVADAFATFAQATEKMINLISSLSMQNGQFAPRRQPVNIVEVVANTCDDFRLEQTNGIKIVTNLPPHENPAIVSGDPELFKKVFTNVLLNAIQSFPNGHGLIEVSVSHSNDGKITTSIKDAGCGIPPEQLRDLFRPFQTTKKHGMGIGLCHTRSIVEMHGGHMRIESQVNSGTQVDIDLPTL
jgi:putative PEP-CTERM system histidine kinase